VVAEFEERHEVSLPPVYRLFVTELGGEGAGLRAVPPQNVVLRVPALGSPGSTRSVPAGAAISS
jgi:hypothetical protein